MSNRFSNPFPQFFNSTPTVYSGGILRFFITGTSTPLAVYSDSALQSSIGTTVTLNSAGRPSTAIFLQNLAYKVTLEDANGVPVWSADPVYASDYSTLAKISGYAGNPNGNVAGTAASGSIPADMVWDTVNTILYICTATGNAAAAVWTAVNAAAATPSVPQPQGRLTLTSGTAVLAGDVAAATAVYYTPYNGNLVPIYNGTSTTATTFAELTLTLVASHAASQIYDVFVFSNSGVVTLATGPAWSTPTAGSGARGTGAGTTQLTRLNGFLVNSVQITGRNGATTYTIAANKATYLGSIFMDGTNGQVSCLVAYGQNRKWGVWNAYNREPIILKAGDSTATWTYATATIRASNNAAANSLTIFSGLAEEAYDLQFIQSNFGASSAGGTPAIFNGIGLNVTNAFSGKSGAITFPSYAASGTEAAGSDMNARYIAAPSLGINTVTALEKGNTSITTTWQGTETNMLLSASWRG